MFFAYGTESAANAMENEIGETKINDADWLHDSSPASNENTSYWSTSLTTTHGSINY